MQINGNRLADRVFWSKKSRIQAEKKLRFNDLTSQIILLWYSAFAVCISILELTVTSKQPYFPAVMVILSVLILCASLFVGNRNFRERAMVLKQSYEKLGNLESLCYETMHLTSEDEKSSKLLDINNQYLIALSMSENHDDNDFKNALVEEYMNTHASDITKLTRRPTIFNVVEIILHSLCKFAFIAFFIALPLFTLFLR
jgi:hypothetical protein